MATLSKDRLRAFEQQAAEFWYREATDSLHQDFAAYYGAMGVAAEQFVALVRDVADWAATYGVKGKADVLRLCIVAAALGHRFWRDPRFRGQVRATLGNADLPVTRRTEPMVRTTRRWLGALWAQDDLRRFGVRLAEHIRRGDDADSGALHGILPGHWQVLNAANNQRFIDGLRTRAYRQVGQSPARRLTYVACALVHGIDWLDDPQLRHLQAALSARSEPSVLADAIAALYAEASA